MKGELGERMEGDKLVIPDGWVIIYWLGDAPLFELPCRRHANTSPILSQRPPA